MLCVLSSDKAGIEKYGMQTVLIACAIAVGIVTVSTLMKQVFCVVRQ